MSYPQPNADQYMLSGSGFFRLNTLLSSPGDIYESPQSAHALCLGPQSDIANVNIAYFDPNVPGFMNFTAIAPRRAFIGQVYARNDAKYAPAQRPGRILFWSDDIFDPNFRPRSFVALTDTIEFLAPRLDVMEYFSPQELGPCRTDRSFVFQDYPVGLGGGTFFLVLPYYGRKYAYIEFTNRNTVTANTLGIIGVNYAITQDDTPNPYTQETVIRAPAAVAPGAQITKIVTAGTAGMFDALVFTFTDNGPAPLRVIVSDESQGT